MRYIFREVTEENKAANKVKFDEKILAIIGNPPYAGISANKGKWIDDLLKKDIQELMVVRMMVIIR